MTSSPDDVAWEFHPDRKSWISAGFPQWDDVRPWLDAGVTNPADAAAWNALLTSPGGARDWMDVGYTHLMVRDWASGQPPPLVFPTRVAVAWDQAGFNARPALAWNEHGFSVEEAAAWHQSGYIPDEAARFRDEGFRVEAAPPSRQRRISQAAAQDRHDYERQTALNGGAPPAGAVPALDGKSTFTVPSFWSERA